MALVTVRQLVVDYRMQLHRGRNIKIGDINSCTALKKPINVLQTERQTEGLTDYAYLSVLAVLGSVPALGGADAAGFSASPLHSLVICAFTSGFLQRTVSVHVNACLTFRNSMNSVSSYFQSSPHIPTLSYIYRAG